MFVKYLGLMWDSKYAPVDKKQQHNYSDKDSRERRFYNP